MEPVVMNSITERIVYTGIYTPDEAVEHEPNEQPERRKEQEPDVRDPALAAR